MTKAILPHELRGRFLGVGSVVEEWEGEASEYIPKISLPYAYQRPARPEEDMIRQFGSVLTGFEEKGTFVFETGFDEYQNMIRGEEDILPAEQYFESLYKLPKHGPFKYLKTQVTSPATMCYSIRGEDGRQHLTPQMFRFFSSLISRIMKGFVAHFAESVETLMVCQDDPAFGFVKDMIESENAPGLSAHQVMRVIDRIFPSEVIPAYHYCYDWRVLMDKGRHLIWQSKPKVVHIDTINYPPEIDAGQGELINKFLQAGGGIALGVIANVDSAFTELVISYYEKSLKKTISLFVRAGVNIDLLKENTMVSTQCGLSGATPNLSRQIHSHDQTYSEILEQIYNSFQ